MHKFSKPPAEFHFAGFTFPKFVFTLPSGSFKARIERMRHAVTGPYYHAPKAGDKGQGFYLESDGMPGLRWEWCDEVQGAGIKHQGWYCDEFGDTTIRGIVMTLPRGRGFIAGWSMGENMASSVDYAIFTDKCDAARVANSMAEHAAEEQRKYEAEERARIESEVE